MGKSLIQTGNQSNQNVVVNGIINPGTVIHRYGQDLRLSGNAIECLGCGYYKVACNVSIAPTAAGPVTVAIYKNGVQAPSAIAYGSVSTAGNPTTLPLQTTVRNCGPCDNNVLTIVLLEGPGVVQNVSLGVEKS